MEGQHKVERCVCLYTTVHQYSQCLLGLGCVSFASYDQISTFMWSIGVCVCEDVAVCKLTQRIFSAFGVCMCICQRVCVFSLFFTSAQSGFCD